MKTELDIPQLNDPEWLRNAYVTKSLQAIANELGVHRNTVRNRLIQFGIERLRCGARLKGVPRSKETRQKMSEARHAYWKEHPDRTEFKMKVSKTKTIHRTKDGGRRRIYTVKTGRVFEHRYVMEQMIGRPLLHDEHVHHIDGNPSNNAPENLQLMSAIEHLRLHAQRRRPKGSSRFV